MIDKIKADLICKIYYESVNKICYSILNHNHHDADDITQEVFLFFQQKCHVLEDNNIRSWLFSVAKLKSMEFLRKQGKKPTFVPIEDYDIEDETANICELLEECNTFDMEKIDYYRDIIFNRLNQREQTLYKMHFVEGKSNTEIAEVLNTNSAHVSVMISRLRKKLELMELLVLCTFGQLIIKLFF